MAITLEKTELNFLSKAVFNIHDNVGKIVRSESDDREFYDKEGNLIEIDISDQSIVSEQKRLLAEYNKTLYRENRQIEYPTIEELVVALYDEEDKQAIIDRRNAVKAKYPKPE